MVRVRACTSSLSRFDRALALDKERHAGIVADHAVAGAAGLQIADDLSETSGSTVARPLADAAVPDG